MFGVILVLLSTFCVEIFDAIGKKKVSDHKEGPYAMSFLSLLGGTIFFALIALFRQETFVFQVTSLPTFIIRAILEVVLIHFAVLAVIKADRTTFSFMRVITIPLVLVIDIILGYEINIWQVLGIALIVLTLILLLARHEVQKTGLRYIIISAIGAVFAISLYKYNITNFNSVTAEQLLMNLFLLIVFFFLAFKQDKQNPFRLLRQPIFFVQSLVVGIGAVLGSFAYLYDAASVITAANRSLAIFWSLISGKTYFKEQHLLFKAIIFLLLVVGLIFLAV